MGVLDFDVMQRMASFVVGTHDFSAFSKEDRDNPGRICSVKLCKWFRYRHVLVLRISADRFLRSMVRYLVDAMIRGGKGSFAVDEFATMLETGILTSQLNPAFPGGLFLWKVRY